MSDRILGAACVVASAGMAWTAQGYAAAISYEPVGPRALPLLLAALLGAGGLWLIVRPTLRGAQPYRGVPLRATLVAFAAVAAYALLFETLGFVLATALMAVPLGQGYGGSFKQSLAGGAALGLVLYFMFDKALDVVLPTGVLAFALAGR